MSNHAHKVSELTSALPGPEPEPDPSPGQACEAALLVERKIHNVTNEGFWVSEWKLL